MSSKEILNIVNEQGEIIGEATRGEIHEKGLLHREVHVWLHTPDGKIIFQLRAKDKDSFPGLLDATVGGHVDFGETIEEAAVRELQEETGVVVDSAAELVKVQALRYNEFDELTGTKNNTISFEYGYLYSGGIENLVPEEGKCDGFFAFSLEEIERIYADPNEAKKFIDGWVNKETIELFGKLIGKPAA